MESIASQASNPVQDEKTFEGKHLSGEKQSTEELVGLAPKMARLVKPLLLAATDNWEMDTLSLAELTDDKPLSTLAVHLFQNHGLPSVFNLDCNKLEKFMLVIENGYPVTNAYHNRSHGASVLHCMHSLLSHGGVAKGTDIAAEGITDRSRRQKFILLAGLLAAAIHDYEHEGVNNDFLVKSSSERAVNYNDKSPNENHHVAAAWRVLQRPDCNFLENMTVKEYRMLRALVVDLVLATDMALHGQTLQKFKGIMTVAGEAKSSGDEARDFTAASAADALVVLQLSLKCADLGHLSLCWTSHMRWVQRLEEEFFSQGDQEAKLGLPESFLMDRKKQGASDTQVGFFDFVVLPLFRGLIGGFSASQPMLSAVEMNYQKWKEIQAEAEACA